MTDSPAARLTGVSVRYDGQVVLGPIDLRIDNGDRWVVLGPNGSGKTSLVRILSLYQYPSTGTVEVLGERWGRTDIRELRKRIALSSAAVADQLRPELVTLDVVMTARHAALEPWWHNYDDADRRRALWCLNELGAGTLADRRFGSLSSGEQQRALIARTLMPEPGLLLLDEPAAGLDLAGREQLHGDLTRLAISNNTPPMVLVTHHTEEIPEGFTHAMLLRAGAAIAAGPIDEVLTGPLLSRCFGLDLELERLRGRWIVWSKGPSTEPQQRS